MAGSHELFDLTGRVALVTGASRGLGREFACALARAGAKVICLARTVEGLKETVDHIVSSGGTAGWVQSDVADTSQARSVVDDVVRKEGRLDILVNNAGTEIPKGVLDVTEQDYDTIMATNLRAVYFMAQAAARHMVRQRKGKIINVGSLACAIGIRGATVYSASKGGVLQFTRALALELAPYNVQVNAIGPGYFRTAMTEPFFQNPQHRQWIESRIPAGRIGEPRDLAGAVIFLAAPASDYVTGQIIYVDGGWLAG